MRIREQITLILGGWDSKCIGAMGWYLYLGYLMLLSRVRRIVLFGVCIYDRGKWASPLCEILL